MHETVGTDSSMIDEQARRTWTSTGGRCAGAAEKDSGLWRLEPGRCRTKIGGPKEIREVRPETVVSLLSPANPPAAALLLMPHTNRVLTVEVGTPVLLLVCEEYSTTSLKQ